jgi:sirohydrochlorin cobaltochelatase
MLRSRAVPPALLIVGHGTRSAPGLAEFRRLLARVRGRLPELEVAGGLLELAGPPVSAAVSTLAAGSRPRDAGAETGAADARDAADGAGDPGADNTGGTGADGAGAGGVSARDGGPRTVAVVPLVLVSAGHAKGDIPAALARERRRHPGLRFRYGRPLGPHPALVSLLAQRVEAALDGAPAAGTAVLLVGRGSTDPDANAETAKVARLLWEGRDYDTVEFGFVSLARPGVPEALDRLRLLGAGRIVVAPYFLFPGVLPDRVAAKAAAFAGAHPGLDVRVAGVLGDSDTLADLVALRYREAVDGDIRMNCDTCQYRVALPGFAHRVGAPQLPHHHPHDPVHDHAH